MKLDAFFGAPDTAPPLHGGRLLLAAIAIGLGNFMVVLDTTIANVSVPTIAGSLGVSTDEGTWVITAYAVAEAITVPLTGWLTKTFGGQRVFITCYLAFGVVSLFCGMSNSLGMLLFGRVLLGLVGGPIIPLSQMLLLRVFPKEQATLGTVLWAMTSLVGPVAGPILGGIICDDYGWPWIFYIKVPMALLSGLAVLLLLRGQPDPTEPARIDKVGFGLLVVWVGALQIMLDQDWFNSPEICVLAAIALVGFLAFLIWELTDEDPVVDLTIFRHRGFTAAAITYAAGFGAFFATVVILPLWLQTNLGYTATWAGYATGLMGIFAVLSAPLVGKAAEKVDPRLLVCLGVAGLGLTTAWRAGFDSDVTFAQLAMPTLVTGLFVVMFFVPVTGLAMASVAPQEQANAAGLSNFLRTLAGAFAASIVQTVWQNAIRAKETGLVGVTAHGGQAIQGFMAAGFSHAQATAALGLVTEGQSVMLATLYTFSVITVVFACAAALIWLAPKPQGSIDLSASH